MITVFLAFLLTVYPLVEAQSCKGSTWNENNIKYECNADGNGYKAVGNSASAVGSSIKTFLQTTTICNSKSVTINVKIL